MCWSAGLDEVSMSTENFSLPNEHFSLCAQSYPERSVGGVGPCGLRG